MKPYILTYSGIQFDFSSPTVEMIDIVDIAHALSNKCRFNGHCNNFYSVAQHCVLMVDALKNESLGVQRQALLHDAEEAYLPDVPTPIKEYIRLRIKCKCGTQGVDGELVGAAWQVGEDFYGNYLFPWRAVAGRIMNCVCRKFDLPIPHTCLNPDEIKAADLRMLATEKRDLMPTEIWSQLAGVKPYDFTIYPWSPEGAKEMFLTVYGNLFKAT